MKLKRLLILICTLVCCLCLGLAVVGCDNGDTPPNPDQNQGQTPGGETPGGNEGENPGENPGGNETNPDLEPFEGNPPICLNHSWGEGYKDVVKKTCTEDGKQVRTCSVCQRREVRTIKSTGHNFVERGGKPATCTEGGYDDYEMCTICGESTRVDQPALGHQLETVPAKDASCTEVGWTEYQRCTRSGCGYNTLDDEEKPDAHYIPLLEHHYESEDKDAPCTMCGKTRYIGSEGLEIVAAGSIARVVGLGTCKETVITIPEEYEGLPVTEINENAFMSEKDSDYYGWDDAKKQAFDEKAAVLNNVTEIRMRGIQRIGGYAFMGMQSLKTIDFGESLQRIGTSVFARCPSVDNIVIPATCSYIEGGAFFYCESLHHITVEEDNQFFQMIDNDYLVVKQTGELRFACVNNDAPEITIPAGIKSLGYYSFAYHTYLKKVTIPGTVETIGGEAFFICTGLEEVTIEAGVKKIEGGAFFSCANLSKVTINTKEVTTEVEGQQVTSMSFETIYEGAFAGCYKLIEITFGGSKADWQKVSRMGNGILKGEATDDSKCLIIKCNDGSLKERTTGDFVDVN